MGKQGSFIKRLTDLLFSLTILIISFPFLLIAALAIKIDSKGPIFFIQDRTGFNGKLFKMIKFRGMVNNALEIGPELTQKNDPRITRVGKFLRRTSIDEIPQVINVLKGEMSIVGPRPEIISITSQYTEDQKDVFNYKPGITGKSQISGRQTLTPAERVEMESAYYKNATFWSDLKILVITVYVVISNKGNL
ncbi:MAG: sugar transferase [Ignavibacteriae bacterium]|nr:MAG: sugar transferase [Ignavibacteriota bacterium]